MTQLQKLEMEVLALQDRLCLRPTLDLASQIGERLAAAKCLVGHGKWLGWLARMAIRPRTAQVYMQVVNAQNSAHLPSGRISIEAFLRVIRGSRRRAWQEEMAQTRQAAIDANPPLDQQYKVIHADCRKYRWPQGIDRVATDPPWRDLEAYRWLAAFAKSHLKEGGLLLAQCGTHTLPDVLDQVRGAGLTYQWMLNIVYPVGTGPVLAKPFANYTRTVIVASNGVWDRSGLPVISDTKTVGRELQKSHHDWQQPLAPWAYWLECLTAPGDLVADPYCGAGTIGVAVRQCGAGRTYIGTEIDTDHVRVARHRIAKHDK